MITIPMVARFFREGGTAGGVSGRGSTAGWGRGRAAGCPSPASGSMVRGIPVKGNNRFCLPARRHSPGLRPPAGAFPPLSQASRAFPFALAFFTPYRK